jgi:hypothetical protein
MSYEKILAEVVEITSAILDLEGGRLFLTIMYELLGSFVAAGNNEGCQRIIQELRDVAMISELDELDVRSLPVWLSIFETTLTDMALDKAQT